MMLGFKPKLASLHGSFYQSDHMELLNQQLILNYKNGCFTRTTWRGLKLSIFTHKRSSEASPRRQNF